MHYVPKGPEDLNEWRLSAWEKATGIVTIKREQIRAIADALTRERTLTEERLKELAANTAAPTAPPSVQPNPKMEISEWIAFAG